MENNWPETVDELLDECQRLISRYDLYTLGEYGEPFTGETKPRVDGTEYLAGEYQYGVAMIPAQWVTHVIETATLGSGTCEFNVVEEFIPGNRQRSNICECSNCGYRCAYGFIVDEHFKCCPNCGSKVIG